jgi:hypothetical protein
MERMKIIIIFNYVVGRDYFLSFVMSIEQPKFKSEFKETTILHSKREMLGVLKFLQRELYILMWHIPKDENALVTKSIISRPLVARRLAGRKTPFIRGRTTRWTEDHLVP